MSIGSYFNLKEKDATMHLSAKSYSMDLTKAFFLTNLTHCCPALKYFQDTVLQLSKYSKLSISNNLLFFYIPCKELLIIQSLISHFFLLFLMIIKVGNLNKFQGKCSLNFKYQDFSFVLGRILGKCL